MLFVLRMLLLALHFVVVGVLGLILVLCRPFNPDNSRLCARLYALPALWFLGLRLKTDLGAHFAKTRPCVVIANHQSNYDLFMCGYVVPPRTVAMGKKSLKWVPLFGQMFWLAGNVLIDRGNPLRARVSIARTTETLQHKDTSIWVFPEGTRNGGKGLLPFKRGAFQMAIDAGVPILPVCISTYSRDMRLNAWNSGQVMIRALPPISTEGLDQADINELASRCHAQMQACIDDMDARLQRRVDNQTAAERPAENPRTR
ncbi:1-acylglycerol-3-phosphate O-acyltransferase [Pseudomonas sp. NPDC090202]|uniref:1-acylglycerol-3-phosphate O-acyltransferase n=1 Tax=unclassified Pseudomonas TaxID=196821 RepID=UPI00380F3027